MSGKVWWGTGEGGGLWRRDMSRCRILKACAAAATWGAEVTKGRSDLCDWEEWQPTGGAAAASVLLLSYRLGPYGRCPCGHGGTRRSSLMMISSCICTTTTTLNRGLCER